MTGRYCVVLPALNAASTIGPLVRSIRAQGLSAVVVNDGSTDQTAAIASAEGALVISHLRNLGKGSALRTGFEYALRSRFDGIVTMDSDGQHDPAEIPRLIQAGERQHAGMVLGDRMADGVAMPMVRRLTNQLMSTLVSGVARQRIADSQCGFRFIRRELLEAVPLRGKRFELETELVFGAAARRWKIISVPVRSIYRPSQSSHIQPLRETVRFLQVVLRYLVRR